MLTCSQFDCPIPTACTRVYSSARRVYRVSGSGTVTVTPPLQVPERATVNCVLLLSLRHLALSYHVDRHTRSVQLMWNILLHFWDLKHPKSRLLRGAYHMTRDTGSKAGTGSKTVLYHKTWQALLFPRTISIALPGKTWELMRKTWHFKLSFDCCCAPYTIYVLYSTVDIPTAWLYLIILLLYLQVFGAHQTDSWTPQHQL